MARDEVLQRVIVVGRDSGHVVVPESHGSTLRQRHVPGPPRRRVGRQTGALVRA